MTVAYYLVPDRKTNLYCRISDGKDRVTFSLDYHVNEKKWNSKKEELDQNDVHYFTLGEFKDELYTKYHLLKATDEKNLLGILKKEAENLMNGKGLDGIAESVFNLRNKDYGIPPYDEFIKAFEKHSG